MKEPKVIERFTDNGEHSHYELIDVKTHEVLWSEDTEALSQHDVIGSVCKCPICLEEMKGVELTHYKCKKCNEYFTN